MLNISQLPATPQIEFRGGNSSCNVGCRGCEYAKRKTTEIEVTAKQQEILDLLNSLYKVKGKDGEYMNLNYCFGCNIGDLNEKRISKLLNNNTAKLITISVIIKDTDIIGKQVDKLVDNLHNMYDKKLYNGAINITFVGDIGHDEVVSFIDKLYEKIDKVGIQLYGQGIPIEKEQLIKLFGFFSGKYKDIRYEIVNKTNTVLHTILYFDKNKKVFEIIRFDFSSSEEREEYKQKMYKIWMNKMIDQLIFSFLSDKIQLQHTFLTVNDKETFISEDEFYQVLHSLAEIKKDKISHIKTVEDILKTYGGYMLEADRIALEEIIKLEDGKYRKHIEENIGFYVVHILPKKYVSSKLAYNKGKLKLLTYKNSKNGDCKKNPFEGAYGENKI